MIATITNTSGITLNTVYDYNGFEGGNMSNPLPGPFQTGGALAASATRAARITPETLRAVRNPYEPETFAKELATLVKKGFLTVAWTKEAHEGTNISPEQLFYEALAAA